MEQLRALVPVAQILVAGGCASTHFADPQSHVMVACAKPWRAKTSAGVVILSVPSIDCSTSTDLTEAAMAERCPPR